MGALEEAEGIVRSFQEKRLTVSAVELEDSPSEPSRLGFNAKGLFSGSDANPVEPHQAVVGRQHLCDFFMDPGNAGQRAKCRSERDLMVHVVGLAGKLNMRPDILWKKVEDRGWIFQSPETGFYQVAPNPAHST